MAGGRGGQGLLARFHGDFSSAGEGRFVRDLCLGRFGNMRQTVGLGDEGTPGMGWSVTAKDWTEAR